MSQPFYVSPSEVGPWLSYFCLSFFPPYLVLWKELLSHVDGRLSEGSCVHRPVNEGPSTSAEILYWSEWSACAALGCWQKRRWPLFWSERSACAALGCWQKRSWPLCFFLVYFSAITKIPEGVVIGLLKFAWASNSQKY
jgi:hypothetical protein